MILIGSHVCTNQFRAAVFRYGDCYYEFWDHGDDHFYLASSSAYKQGLCGACLDVTLTYIADEENARAIHADQKLTCTWEDVLADPLSRLMEVML